MSHLLTALEDVVAAQNEALVGNDIASALRLGKIVHLLVDEIVRDYVEVK